MTRAGRNPSVSAVKGRSEGLTLTFVKRGSHSSLTIVEARISIDLYNELIRDDLGCMCTAPSG